MLALPGVELGLLCALGMTRLISVCFMVSGVQTPVMFVGLSPGDRSGCGGVLLPSAPGYAGSAIEALRKNSFCPSLLLFNARSFVTTLMRGGELTMNQNLLTELMRRPSHSSTGSGRIVANADRTGFFF